MRAHATHTKHHSLTTKPTSTITVERAPARGAGPGPGSPGRPQRRPSPSAPATHESMYARAAHITTITNSVSMQCARGFNSGLRNHNSPSQLNNHNKLSSMQCARGWDSVFRTWPDIVATISPPTCERTPQNTHRCIHTTDARTGTKQ